MFNRTAAPDPTPAPAHDAIGNLDWVPLAAVLPEVHDLGIETIDQLEAHIGADRVFRLSGLVPCVTTSTLADSVHEVRERREIANQKRQQAEAEWLEQETIRAAREAAWRAEVTAVAIERGLPFPIAVEIVNGERDPDGMRWKDAQRVDDIITGTTRYVPLVQSREEA